MSGSPASLEDDLAPSLARTRAGDRKAADHVARAVYDDLCRLAHRHLQTRSMQTLDTVGLVSEAYLRIIERGKYALNDRKHFFAVAAQIMRQILCDHARRRLSQKRSCEYSAVDLSEASLREDSEAAWMLDLDAQLRLLEHERPLWSRLVELKYFGGLTEQEIARSCALSLRQVQREWAGAREWLKQRLSGRSPRTPGAGQAASSSPAIVSSCDDRSRYGHRGES